MNISKRFDELTNSSNSLTPFQARIRCGLVCVICYIDLFIDRTIMVPSVKVFKDINIFRMVHFVELITVEAAIHVARNWTC